MVLGRSRKVVGGAVRTQVTRRGGRGGARRRLLSDGGTRRPAAARRAGSASRRSGCRTRAIRRSRGTSRRSSAAIATSRRSGPSAVLFNGGVMRADRFRTRMAEVLASWRGDGGNVRVLAGADPDLAVARGAATYGLARRGRGVRIRGGTARAYYVGVETAAPGGARHGPAGEGAVRGAVRHGGRQRGRRCRTPSSGSSSASRRVPLLRLVGAPRRRSGHRGRRLERGRARGAAAARDDARDGAEKGGTVPVRLEAQVTEVGTLALWCVARDQRRRWKLEFNVRAR